MDKFTELLFNGPLTEEEQAKRALNRVVAEYWDIINMSYSSEEDNRYINIYDALNPPDEASKYPLWCPMRTAPFSSKTWLSYSFRAREAIRLGFRKGLGIRISLHSFNDYPSWLNSREPIVESLQITTKMIVDQAINNQQIPLGIQQIESILTSIYAQGGFIPYHPLFDQRFKNQFSATPLHEINGFLDGECIQYGLSNKEGLEYLSDLIADIKATGHVSSVVTNRATSWLKNTMAALDAKASVQNRTVQPNLAGLCQNGFTPSDMSDLLRLLGLIDQNDTCVIAEEVIGRAASKRSKFTAAYRVLRYEGLLANTTSDTEWVDAFAKAYKVQLSDKVRAYELSASGRVSDSASKDFRIGVEQVRHWVHEWRQKHTKSLGQQL